MATKQPRVLVTGANGPLGRRVALHLLQAGAGVTGLSRKPAPIDFSGAWQVCDLLQTAPVQAALERQDTVVHCASNVENPQDDADALNHLIAASQALGTVRIIYVSICGIDSAAQASSYYAIKLRNETRLQQSGTPYTTVRIAQFFPFLASLLPSLVHGSEMLVPDVFLQPVDLDFAAKLLASTALGTVKDRAPDIHGPETLSLKDMAEAWSITRGYGKTAVWSPTEGMMKGFAAISPVVGTGGGPTWAQWLATTPTQSNPYGEKQLL